MAIDDLTLFDVGGRRLFLIEHHGTKKVHWRVFPVFKIFGKLARDIFP